MIKQDWLNCWKEKPPIGKKVLVWWAGLKEPILGVVRERGKDGKIWWNYGTECYWCPYPEIRQKKSNKSLQQNFSSILSSRINEIGISQSELARRLGVNRAWISKIIMGKVNVTVETIDKICLAMNCSCQLIVERK